MLFGIGKVKKKYISKSRIIPIKFREESRDLTNHRALHFVLTLWLRIFRFERRNYSIVCINNETRHGRHYSKVAKDYLHVLQLKKLLFQVNSNSIAEKAGLQPGDALIRINNVELFDLAHKDAQNAIVRAGNNFELTIQRFAICPVCAGNG